MNVLYKPDEYVVYGKMGVCRVVRREHMSFGAAGSGEYYVLSPTSDPRSSVYVPCDNEELMARLRPVFSKQEIDKILRDVPDGELEWVEDKNERATLFRRLLSEGDRRQLLRLIRCLYAKKQEKVDQGKKLSCVDETTLQDCVRLVEDEFSISLGIEKQKVGAYIRACLDDVPQR